MEKERSEEATQCENDIEQYLTFHLGDELYGFKVNNIREVIEYNQISSVTQIPLVPEYIKGVINLRGEVVPVIDLSMRFYNHMNEITRRTCIVMIEVEDEGEIILVGAMIDAVNAVVDILPDDIESTMGFGAKIRSDFISGIGKIDDDKFVILLNLNRVLNIDDISNFGESDTDLNTLMLLGSASYS
ncbi:MAG: chemotaxis protein CheW [Spirochaetota bacterium]|nr:chemotaxis protein CheW [Spirochaetota bacterium]